MLSELVFCWSTSASSSLKTYQTRFQRGQLSYSLNVIPHDECSNSKDSLFLSSSIRQSNSYYVKFRNFISPKDRLICLSKQGHLFEAHMLIFPSWVQQLLKSVDTFMSKPRGPHCLDATDCCNERKCCCYSLSAARVHTWPLYNMQAYMQ